MSDSLTRRFHVTEARDGASSTVLEGTEQLVPGVRVVPAAFASTPALVAPAIGGRRSAKGGKAIVERILGSTQQKDDVDAGR